MSATGPPKSSVYRKKIYTIEKGLDGITDYIVIRSGDGDGDGDGEHRNPKVWDLLSNYKSYKTRIGQKYYIKKTAAELAAEDIV
jgi:hypothetical protein